MLTPEHAEYAKEQHLAGVPIKSIARKLGTSYYMVRTSFDLEYKRLVAARKKAWDDNNKNRIPQPDDRVIPISVPRKVLRERDDAYSCPMTFSQIIFGDPPYCRSALGRKEAHG